MFLTFFSVNLYLYSLKVHLCVLKAIKGVFFVGPPYGCMNVNIMYISKPISVTLWVKCVQTL